MIAGVVGAGGAALAVRVAGDPARPPIVFVHGWAQSGAVWANQFADPDLLREHYLLAVDLRGHGSSDIPDDGYDNPAVWAEDLAAVLRLAGSPATVVGWSYGGLVITDYVRERGCAELAGIVLVGALTEIGKNRPGGAIGSLMRDAIPGALSEDPALALPTVATLTAGMTAEPASGGETQRRIGATLSVPPRVRKALFKRDTGSADVLSGITVPTLVAHGTEDRVVDPAAAAYALGKIPGATARWFPGVGHLPFAERVDEFNRTLREAAVGRKG
ncbi:alpha/beta fold hydrolase [Actinokineospora iranica]|uniref:Pimeloyl-ACP methyl ester carboxylesterase n=1 Tax=Actinokineospora iranica TaxID=1271860 RepID=A0A1G6UMC3_9PSEU|nr:alpha/beta hydrolase [Actinokineospora iranica]SDD42508.1 Pimeloyl-ACP methyl ester carboxylesterase [Actinokineospora iranica]